MVLARILIAYRTDLGTDDVLSEKLVGSEDMLGLDHLNKSRTVYKGDVMMIR